MNERKYSSESVQAFELQTVGHEVQRSNNCQADELGNDLPSKSLKKVEGGPKAN